MPPLCIKSFQIFLHQTELVLFNLFFFVYLSFFFFVSNGIFSCNRDSGAEQ